MKSYIIIMLFCFAFKAKAQTSNVFSKKAFIESYTLEVTYNKTTNLVFPSAITSVDRGSRDILVQKANGVENILRIKADLKDFVETSLSIITADGKLYSFVVVYAKQPSYLNVNVARISEKDSVITNEKLIYAEPGMNKGMLAVYADSVLKKGSDMRTIRNTNSDVSIGLNAFYIHEDVMFCRFILKNNSPINFDIEQLHFYILDRKKTKRTSSQEVEITPLFIAGDTMKIRAGAHQTWIIALPKFTIPDGKFMSVEMMEKNGGRNLFLKVKNRHIMKATTL